MGLPRRMRQPVLPSANRLLQLFAFALAVQLETRNAVLSLIILPGRFLAVGFVFAQQLRSLQAKQLLLGLSPIANCGFHFQRLLGPMHGTAEE